MADIVGVVEAALDDRVEQAIPLAGGDVAMSYRMSLSDRIVFAKTKQDAQGQAGTQSETWQQKH